jgi:hypothetical protein
VPWNKDDASGGAKAICPEVALFDHRLSGSAVRLASSDGSAGSLLCLAPVENAQSE